MGHRPKVGADKCISAADCGGHRCSDASAFKTFSIHGMHKEWEQGPLTKSSLGLRHTGHVLSSLIGDSSIIEDDDAAVCDSGGDCDGIPSVASVASVAALDSCTSIAARIVVVDLSSALTFC
jgi:hypothetical protein